MKRARVTREGRRPLSNLISFLLFGVYLLCCMMLVLIGIRAYRHAQDTGVHADGVRLSLGYVANKVRAEDRAGAISIEDRNGIETLVIRHDYDIPCETRIYYYQGALCEMFLLSDADIQPEYGARLTRLDEFSMKLTDERALSFTARDARGDTREMTVWLRAGGEAGG